jgi:hypothetical protein
MKKTVNIETGLIKIVKVVADSQNLTIGEYVEAAIKEKLEKMPRPKNGRAILKSGNIELHITRKESA